MDKLDTTEFLDTADTLQNTDNLENTLPTKSSGRRFSTDRTAAISELAAAEVRVVDWPRTWGKCLGHDDMGPIWQILPMMLRMLAGLMPYTMGVVCWSNMKRHLSEGFRV